MMKPVLRLDQFEKIVTFPHGMKRPVGENEHYSTPVKDTVTSNDGILRLPLRIKPSSEMMVFCFALAG